MNKNLNSVFFIFLLSLALSSCSKEKTLGIPDADEQETPAVVETNNPEGANPNSGDNPFTPVVTEKTLTASDVRSLNPLKGFVPFEGAHDSFPHSMEFFYIPVKDVMSGNTTFDFESSFETKLDAIAARGHQAVFRFYLDYPTLATGVPAYLITAGVPMISYTDYGGGTMPDYNNATLIDAMVLFIEELGKRYDGDPRIGFIFTGLIGHWGEWHTYPNDQYMASDANQLKILEAYNRSFQKTKLLTRKPSSQLQNLANVGIHDDSFSYVDSTLPTQSWSFMAQVATHNLSEVWKTRPVGGELRPEIQLTVWDDPLPNDAQSFSACRDATHASWLLAHQLFSTTLSDSRRSKALAGAASLGYDFVVEKVKLQKNEENWTLELVVKNRGNAPFYYNWPLEIGLGTSADAIESTQNAKTELTKIAAGESVSISETLSVKGLETRYIFLRIPNPLTNGMPLRFSNVEQDQGLTGWLSLGEF